MTDRNVIVETIDDLLKSKGLSKHSGSWYRRSAETISVLNLQKSQYSRLYYLNFGIWILSAGDADYPKPNKCHIVGRVSNLLNEKSLSKRLEALLDLEHSMSDQERRSELIEILDVQITSFLKYSSSVADLQVGGGQFIVASSGIRSAVVELFTPR
jgi:hypothetical protein